MRETSEKTIKNESFKYSVGQTFSVYDILK